MYTHFRIGKICINILVQVKYLFHSDFSFPEACTNFGADYLSIYLWLVYLYLKKVIDIGESILARN